MQLIRYTLLSLLLIIPTFVLSMEYNTLQWQLPSIQGQLPSIRNQFYTQYHAFLANQQQPSFCQDILDHDRQVVEDDNNFLEYDRHMLSYTPIQRQQEKPHGFVYVPHNLTKKFSALPPHMISEQIHNLAYILTHIRVCLAKGIVIPEGILCLGEGINYSVIIEALAAQTHSLYFEFVGNQQSEMSQTNIKNLFYSAQQFSIKYSKKALVLIRDIDSLKEHYPITIELIKQFSHQQRQHRTLIFGTATNIRNVDKALLRDDRFHYIVQSSPLSLEQRKDILEHYLSKLPGQRIVRSVQALAHEIGKETDERFDHSDLEKIIQQANLNAAEREFLSTEDLKNVVLQIKASKLHITT